MSKTPPPATPVQPLIMPFPHWNTVSKPPDEMLRPVWRRGDYVVIGGSFLVVDRGEVRVANFQRPPREDGSKYDGYWDNSDFIPERWMQFPSA